MAQRAESKIETKAKSELAAWCSAHGIKHQYLKFTSPGFRGWPDRLILWDGGHVMFVEWKAPDGEYEPLQEYVHELLRAMGHTIEVHNNVREFMESVTSKMVASRSASQGHEVDRVQQGIPSVPTSREG